MRPFLSLRHQYYYQVLKDALGVGSSAKRCRHSGPFELVNDAISLPYRLLRNEDKCVINGELLHRFRKRWTQTPHHEICIDDFSSLRANCSNVLWITLKLLNLSKSVINVMIYLGKPMT